MCRTALAKAFAAKLGVWWVIKNRVAAAPRWPASIAGVILQHEQFSSFNANDPNVTRFPVPPIGTATPSGDWQAFAESLSAVGADGMADPTKGATFYESYPVAELAAVRAKMPWFAEANLMAHIGTIRFYKS